MSELQSKILSYNQRLAHFACYSSTNLLTYINNHKTYYSTDTLN